MGIGKKKPVFTNSWDMTEQNSNSGVVLSVTAFMGLCIFGLLLKALNINSPPLFFSGEAGSPFPTHGCYPTAIVTSYELSKYPDAVSHKKSC